MLVNVKRNVDNIYAKLCYKNVGAILVFFHSIIANSRKLKFSIFLVTYLLTVTMPTNLIDAIENYYIPPPSQK
jgi:hypothetical protein